MLQHRKNAAEKFYVGLGAGQPRNVMSVTSYDLALLQRANDRSVISHEKAVESKWWPPA